MSEQLKAAVRSFATTFLAVFLGLIPVAAVADGDLSWASSALVSALVAGLRTVIAALDPGQPLYGVGSQPTP